MQTALPQNKHRCQGPNSLHSELFEYRFPVSTGNGYAGMVLQNQGQTSGRQYSPDTINPDNIGLVRPDKSPGGKFLFDFF